MTSDDEVDAWVRANVETAYHPTCTCKIGTDDDPMAVVDPQSDLICDQNSVLCNPEDNE